jgi:glycosyltransferase involved in cell wall biosynthesis
MDQKRLETAKVPPDVDRGARLRVVAVCFSPTVGGLELATLRRASELQQHGYQATAVLPDAPELIDHARRLGLTVDVITPSLPYLDPFAAWKLRQVIRRTGADLLLVARTRDLSTALLAAPDNVAVVLYQQMQSGLRKRDLFHDWVFRRLDGCIAITQHTGDQIVDCTALDAAKVSVIPYGVDTRRFAPDAVDRSAARRQFDVPEDAFVVGIIGNFNVTKGQREFIEAMGMAAKMEPALAASLQALVIGQSPSNDPAYIRELHALRDSLPIADRIHLHPFQTDPRLGFAALDLFVLASYAETFGMVVQEALAMGTAVIATGSEGVREIVSDGETGIIIPARNPEAIAEAVVRLFRDPGLRHRLATRGRAFACEAYDDERQRTAFERALYQAVARRRSVASKLLQDT